MKKILGILGIINLMINCASLATATTGDNIKTNLVKEETNINNEAAFAENFELETPIAHVAEFYTTHSAKNTFTWTKKLPSGIKYNFFKIVVENSSKYWVESNVCGFVNQDTPYNFTFIKDDMTTIPLVENTKYDKKILEIKYEYIK